VPSSALLVAAVAASGTVSAVIDLRTRRVPNWLTVSTAASGLALAGLGATGQTVASAAAGCGLGLLMMLPGYIFGKTGGGDVKLFAAFGTLLGPRPIAMAFFYTAIAGGVLALAVAVHRKRMRQSCANAARLVQTGGTNVGEIEDPALDNRFAYAPAIAVGVLAAAWVA
jgi:prepilin peptidase CpaA